MDMERLKQVQQQLFFELGYKVDLYHNEPTKQILVVRNDSGAVVKMYSYD